MKTTMTTLLALLLAAAAALGAAAPEKKIPVIYDSDIGDDIDDTWALGFLLKSPELDLKLVVGDQGRTRYRATLFARFLQRAGRTDVPVGIGLDIGRTGAGPQAAWVADYDLDRYPGTVHRDGVQAMIDLIMASPRPITLIAVGPLPNVAEALRREPRIAEKARFAGMHGSVRRGYGGSKKISAEYNVRADAGACQKALAAPWDITITPLDTCGLVHLRGAKYKTVRASSAPVARAIIENYRIWAQHKKYGAFAQRSSTLFDTVAVYLAFRQDLCTMEKLGIRVDEKGYTRIDPGAKTMHVATAWKDRGAFEDLLVERLTAGEKKPVSVIFDTDMGSDCDDAGALALLHALADRGEVDPVGVIFSSGRNRFGAGVCDAINTWYGRGDLPLGQYAGRDVGDPRDHYCRRIARDTETFGHDTVDDATDMIAAYTDMLRSRPDGSITIVTVGHPHALVHLMRNEEAAGLVRRKVSRWVAMGGTPEKPKKDWNFTRNGMDAYLAELLEKWPTAAYFSSAGKAVLTGHRRLPATPEHNPVREAYRLWNNAGCLEKGRSSWDQVAVLAAVRPELFTTETRGRLECAGNGTVAWNAKEDNPLHHRLHPKISREDLAETIAGLMAATPRHQSPRGAAAGAAPRSGFPEDTRNLLLDATLSGNLASYGKGLRGGADHVAWDPQAGRFGKASQWHEYGVGFGADLGVVPENNPAYWQAAWKEPVEANTIALSGVYPNQPQPHTAWKIAIRRDGTWHTLARGTGGWYNTGRYTWGGPGKPPRRFDALRVAVFSRDDKTPIKSIHFRGEEGVSWVVARCPAAAAKR